MNNRGDEDVRPSQDQHCGQTGAVIQLVARDPALGSASLDLPILPPIEEYAGLTPTPAAPSTSATASPTASVAGSPASTPQPPANPSGAAHQPTPSASG